MSNLDSIYPDNSRFSINMHYQSDSTGEFATFRINKHMSIEQILDLYARLVPIECNAFLKDVENANKNLHRPGGMSLEGRIMVIGRIPEIVMKMIDFIYPGFFEGAVEGGRNFRRFIRAYPKFAIGDHSRKLINPGARTR